MQLLLDAAHQVVEQGGAAVSARQIEDLVRNPEHFCLTPADAFKVWPTNRDRGAFNEVMQARPPVDYAGLEHGASRMAQTHRYFTEAITEWLHESDVTARAGALASVLLYQLQVVVIQLGPDEDAQEIFETLNARGTPLSAADLVKNFIFQRLALDDAAAEEAYHEHWQEFETAFWEKEVGSGASNAARSSLFLNQWLVAQTGRDITTREVFTRFKSFAEHESVAPMADLLPAIHSCASTYRGWVEGAARPEGVLSRLELFVYRTTALDSEVAKPLLLWATDPRLEPLPAGDLDRLLDTVESWLVRRALLRLPNKNYTRFLADLLGTLRNTRRDEAAAVVRATLSAQDSPSAYWPGDDEVRRELREMPIYRRLRRSRVRMVLEAVEDQMRGFGTGGPPLSAQPVVRDRLVTEHLLPQKWEAHWPVGADPSARARRSQCVHLLGNLTLLTGRLNRKVSHGAWLGPNGKRAALERHDTLLLNRHVRQIGAGGWAEPLIHERTDTLIDAILHIWPVPDGHSGHVAFAATKREVPVGVLELISEGLLTVGQHLLPRSGDLTDKAIVLADGSLQVGDHIYDTPSGSGKAVLGRTVNGWSFWQVDMRENVSLGDIRAEYAATFDVDTTAEDAQDMATI